MSGVKVWVKMMPLMSFKKSQLFVPLLCSRNVFIHFLSADVKDRVSVDWSFAGLPCHKVTISARAFQGLRAVLAKPCGSHPFSWFLRPIFVVAKKAANEPVKYIILFVFYISNAWMASRSCVSFCSSLHVAFDSVFRCLFLQYREIEFAAIVGREL